MAITIWDALRFLVYVFIIYYTVDIIVPKKINRRVVVVLFITVWFCMLVIIGGFGLYRIFAA